MTGIPEIERIVAASHIADGERVVFIDVAKHAVRTALDRQAREIVEALRQRAAECGTRDAEHETAGIMANACADFIEGRFVRKDESDE